MTTKFPPVKLGEVLKHRKEFIAIDDLTTYKRPRVQLHSRGIVLRDEIPGALIKTKKQQVCRAGEFLVAEIDAKVGGFGIVPEELDRCIVSSHYFLFVLDEVKLDRSFLDYFIRTPAFREQVEAQGSTNYAAIRPSHVLDYEIPLPPLMEQQRIVARIEEFCLKINETLLLRKQIDRDIDRLLASAYYTIVQSAPKKALREIAPLVRRRASVEFDGSYPQVAVRSFGRGTFHKPPMNGSEITWQKPHLVKEGDILISNIKSWEGAIAVAGAEDNGRFGSHRYLTFVPIEGKATAAFLCFHLLTPEGLQAVGEVSPGSADRNRTLNTGAFAEMVVPMPAYEKQVWFDSLSRKVDSLRRTQYETTVALNALMHCIIDKVFRGELPADSVSKSAAPT